MLFRTAVPHTLPFAAAFVLLQVPTPAHAGPHQNARFLVHLTAPVGKNACDLMSDPPGCIEIETSGQVGTEYSAYVIISNLSSTAGMSGARFGIAYDGAPFSGVEVSSWTSCADNELPVDGWPGAGGGNTLIWNIAECFYPPTVNVFTMAVVGYFHLSAYTPDEIQVTPRPSDNEALVVDCSTQVDVIESGIVNPFGWATFSANGSVLGSNPCGLDNGGCHVSGPTGVDTGQTDIQYTMDPEEVTPTGGWTVIGNAQIVTSNNSAVTVNATLPGTFYIRYQRLSDCVEGCGCGIEVQVFGPVATQPTTWGRIKATFTSTDRK